jgi:hypothetical protein
MRSDRIDYDVTTGKWTLGGGKPKGRPAAMLALMREGCSHEVAEALLRANKLCAEIEYRHRFPPADELLTYEQARVLLLAVVANGLDRQRSLRKAERWVRANLRPGKKRISCYALKHTLDHWYQRRGSACYLREADFIDVLRCCGHVVKNGHVRIAEVPA